MNQGTVHLSAERTVLTLLLAVAAVLLACHIAQSWPFTPDDAFITLRYAGNLAGAGKPVFDIRLAPAEGCTTFLWMLVMVIPHACGLDALVFAKVAGLVAFCAVFSLAYVAARRIAAACGMAESHLPGVAAVCLLAAYAPASIHAVSGMETMLFAALLLACCLGSSACVRECTTGRAAGLALTALAMGLTRPEGNLAAAAILLTVFVLVPAQHRLTFAGAVACFYVIPGIAYFLWRAAYYGHLLPLAFYIKVSSSWLAGWEEVAQFATYLLTHVGVLLIFAFVGLTRAGARQWLPSVVGCAVLAAFFVIPKHIMSYDFRYLFPIIPVAFAFAGAGLAVAVGALRYDGWRGGPIGPLAILAVLVCLSLGMAYEGRPSLRKRRFYGQALEACHVALGKELYQLQSSAANPTLAVLDAGAIPYYSHWTSIDTFGLNDAHIAISGSRDPKYVLAYRPTVVIVVSRAEDRFGTALGCEQDRELYHACLTEGYERARVVPFEQDAYYLWVLCKPDSPLYRQLRE
jgi:arabinofuranosyltransferase